MGAVAGAKQAPAMTSGYSCAGDLTGKTHSFFDHTPEPYGHDVRPTLLSKSALQYSGPYCLSASMSCTTSNKPPSSDLQDADRIQRSVGATALAYRMQPEEREASMISVVATLEKKETCMRQVAGTSEPGDRVIRYNALPVDDLIKGVGFL